MNQTTATLPAFAKNKDEFLSALFTGPSTFDGYVERVNKNEVCFTFRKHTLAFNRRGLILTRSKLANGRNWFSYAPSYEWPFSDAQTRVIFEQTFAPLLK